MATLTVQTVIRAGIEPTYAAAEAGGDAFVNTGFEFVHIKNGAGADCEVTIETPNTVDGLAIADRVVDITAGEERMIGPFPAGTYNDANSKVQMTYESETSLTIAVLKLGST